MKWLLFSLYLLFSASAFCQNLDEKWVLNWNQERNMQNDNFFLGLSQSADYIAIATPITILTAGFIKQDAYLKQKGLQSGLAVLGTYGVGYILKKSIKRDRPFNQLSGISPVQYKDAYSMPSGSAAVAFASATSLTVTFPKWYVAVPAFGYAGAVGYARIRSGEHYPSDVLVGAVLGAGSVWVAGKLTKLINKN